MLEYALTKRTELAMQKIGQAESSVVADLRANALNITMDAARSLILESMSPEVAEEILSKAFQDIELKLHENAVGPCIARASDLHGITRRCMDRGWRPWSAYQ